MQLIARLCFLFTLLVTGVNLVHAGSCGGCQKDDTRCKATCDRCCEHMGGVMYCDSSVGRQVCNNGSYSSCYCTRHAVMDLDHIQGCCLWQGGVLAADDGTGSVLCNDGAVSSICSFESLPQSVATW